MNLQIKFKIFFIILHALDRAHFYLFYYVFFTKIGPVALYYMYTDFTDKSDDENVRFSQCFMQD